jgi:prophage regulatory protein
MNESNVRARIATENVSSLPNSAGTPSTMERLIRLPQVLDMVGLGKTTIYAMVKDGEFPEPRKIRHLSVWVESEIQAWIGKIAEAPKGA